MADLSERQLQILKAIIDEFIAGAEPIGSEVLTERYQFPFSPATVRNEMAILHREGFIEKPHSSAGRRPTELGLRYYITSLMQENPLPVLQEVAIKQRLFQYRQSYDRMLREATLALAVFAHYGNEKRGGVVAVLGPDRLSYPAVVPQVRYMAQLLTELSSSF